MLVRITQKCDMGCNHCMVNAKPDGDHMTMEMYKDVLEFILWTGIPLMMFSGGEPTQHPDVIEMINMAIQRSIKVVLLSNGTFLEKPELRKQIEDLNISVQITNDARYYPRTVPVVDNPNFLYTDELRIITLMGRAEKNELEANRQSPQCFNIRSMTRSLGDFNMALMQHRMTGKMCTPSINIDGTLSAGESNFCKSFGTIYDKGKLTENLCNFKCNECGLIDKLQPNYRAAIGEL